MKGYQREPKTPPEEGFCLSDRCQVPDTRHTNIQPLAAGVHRINLFPSGGRETLHATVAGAEQNCADSLEGEVDPGVDSFNV